MVDNTAITTREYQVLSAEDVRRFSPTSLDEALSLMAERALIPYAGGTDLMVKEAEARPFIYLHNIAELKTLKVDGEYLRIGAGLTFSELLAANKTPAILKEAIAQIAAPAIRNTATLGGNIANASPKGDGALICAVADCQLLLASADGSRKVDIMSFYMGRNKTALAPGELLVEIIMPLKHLSNYQFTKVGARNALAISRASFAALISINAGRIEHLAMAFGAVEDKVLRTRELDNSLIGLTVEEARKEMPEYLALLGRAIDPIKGRVSAQYRRSVCLNLARDFLHSRLSD